MYGPVKICDHHIVAINQSNATIIAQKGKNTYIIDLRICAENFKNKYSTSNGNCVGDRNIQSYYFCLYTSDRKTMICFKRFYVFRLFGKELFGGNRTQRFRQLQKALTQLGYRTYDLT